MKLKIRTKIILLSTFFYTALLIILGFLVLYDIYYSIAATYDAKLNSYLELVEEYIDKFLTGSGNHDFKKFKHPPYYGIEKVNVEIYDNRLAMLSKSDPALSDEVREYFFKKERDRICMIGENETCYYFANKEKHFGKDTIHIAAAIAITQLNLKYYEYKFSVIGIIPVAILLITIVSFYMSKLAFRPVRRMVKDVKLIIEGNTQNRISVPDPKDEIRELGVTLNKMLDSIEESMVAQKKFIENASHEIKTPLTIIRTKLELISDYTDDEKKKNELEELIFEIDKLTELSKSLLTLAGLDAGSTSGSKSPVRLDELIVDVTKSFQSAARKKNIKIVPIIREVIELQGYEEKLKSMLMNLVDNAVKYSEDGKEVKIILDQKENSAIIEINDCGIGIFENDLPNIFKRFYRSDQIRTQIQGSGLGLCIVEEIVKQHNGKITINSKIGEGTSVKLVFSLST